MKFMLYLPNPDLQGVIVGNTRESGWVKLDDGGNAVIKDTEYNYNW